MNALHDPVEPVAGSEPQVVPVEAQLDSLPLFIHRLIFPAIVSLSISVGLWIPWFYNWSGSDQSKSPPIVGIVLMGWVALSGITLLSVPFLPGDTRPPVARQTIFPFAMRTMAEIFGVMVICTLMFQTAAAIPIGVIAFLYPLGCAVYRAIRSPELRWRIIAVYSCLYGPFTWICTNADFLNSIKRGQTQLLWMLPGIPAMLISFFVRSPSDREGILSTVVSITVTGIAVLVGLKAVQKGRRTAIAYQIVLLAIMVLSSFGLYALFRA